MFIAALFTIAKLEEQSKCPLRDEWIKHLWDRHIMQYNSAIRKSKILPFATAWLHLEGTVLTEMGQPEKDNYHVISLRCGM